MIIIDYDIFTSLSAYIIIIIIIIIINYNI